MELASNHHHMLESLITHRFEDAEHAFKLAETRTEDVIRIVFHPGQ